MVADGPALQLYLGPIRVKLFVELLDLASNALALSIAWTDGIRGALYLTIAFAVGILVNAVIAVCAWRGHCIHRDEKHE